MMEISNDTDVNDTYISVQCPKFMNKKGLYLCLGSLAFIAACMPANIVAGVHLFQVRANDTGNMVPPKQDVNDTQAVQNKTNNGTSHVAFDRNNQV